MFSRRLDWDRPENALAAAENARRAAGPLIADLTVSNPTRVGLPYPEAALRQALADGDDGVGGLAAYEATPRGLPSARVAIAADYGRRGISVDAGRLVVTASSSESYALLFKLLGDPGDAVLVPEPSYPLFEYLARLEGVAPVPYRLAYDGSWHVDLGSVASALEALRREGRRARALVVVSPNNPTGSFIKRGELARLSALAAAAQMAIVADEVFADYPSGVAAAAGDEAPVACAAVDDGASALTFSLGGLSKSCGLPQMKLGWILAGGPPSVVAAALARLELVADTYLSAGTPVQRAAGRLFDCGAAVRTAIADRVAENRARLRALLPASSPCTLLPSEGGWSAILRVPAIRSDEAWAETLLREEGILVQPGYFFDMPPGAFLVLSLLPPPDLFAQAVARVVAVCGGSAEG